MYARKKQKRQVNDEEKVKSTLNYENNDLPFETANHRVNHVDSISCNSLKRLFIFIFITFAISPWLIIIGNKISIKTIFRFVKTLLNYYEKSIFLSCPKDLHEFVNITNDSDDSGF